MVTTKTSTNNCEFCLEISQPTESFFYRLFKAYGLKSRIIFENSKFLVMPGLGALTEGYLLLLPRKHYISLSHMSELDLKEFEGFKAFVSSTLKEEYPNLVSFEHGAVSNTITGGACIDHAHLHICSCPEDLLPELSKRFSYKEIPSFLELKEYHRQGQPYILYENHLGKLFVFIVPKKIESQFMRRIWATSLGIPDKWDWGVYIEKENVLRTIKKSLYYYLVIVKVICFKQFTFPKMLKWFSKVS